MNLNTYNMYKPRRGRSAVCDANGKTWQNQSKNDMQNMEMMWHTYSRQMRPVR
jgi:hypothetical protein